MGCFKKLCCRFTWGILTTNVVKERTKPLDKTTHSFAKAEKGNGKGGGGLPAVKGFLALQGRYAHFPFLKGLTTGTPNPDSLASHLALPILPIPGQQVPSSP